MMVKLLLLSFLIFTGWFFWEKSRRRVHSVLPGLHPEIDLPHRSEFELYHNSLSFCSMKSRVCMAELQIPYESHPVDLIETGSYQTISRDFLAVNPAGTVPVLVHNGHPVYESHEQIRYEAAHAPSTSPSLVPDDPGLRDEMNAWVDRSSITEDPLNEREQSVANSVAPLTSPLFATMMERIPARRVLEGLLFHLDRRRPVMFLSLKLLGIERMPRIKPVGELLSSSRNAMNTHFDALEKQLSGHGGPCILGDQYTLADVSWLVIFERLEQTDYLGLFLGNGKRPVSAVYWDRLRARSSYGEAISGFSHPLITYGTQRIKEAKAGDPALKRFLEGA
jgi:glutathione S-transferase